ncbi:HK97 family phage prohead protease [Shinella sp. M31]|uniref:HK97 family phage prohead protease n=1 Tax=Shinella sp. M31 TaxID=3368615 RepID=UPI003BA1EAE5
MRPAPIIIPGLPRASPRFQDRRPLPEARRTFRDSNGRELAQPAIQGFACLFETAFEHEGRLVYFKGDAFVATLHDGKVKRLLLDHSAGKQVGSTASGLEFSNTTRGLAFRHPLAGADGETIHRNVVDGTRACLSVGITLDEYETREVAGHLVDIVARASLSEVSLVKQGAVPETFASIVDLTNEPDLWTAARQPAFARAKVVANVEARARRIIERLAT